MTRRVRVSAHGRSLAGSVATETTFEVTQGGLGLRCFLEATLAAGFKEERRSSWPCEATLDDVGKVLYREANEGVFLVDADTLAHVSLYDGWCTVRVSSVDREKATTAMAAFAQAYPALYREQNGDDGSIVPITFWTLGPHGPISRMRMIDSASWEDIAGNYSDAVVGELDRLMSDDFEPGGDGQLFLWQGEPGTGKTWALRALATEWRPWCEFHYITDPDAFFVRDPSYMIDVLLSDTYEEYVSTDTGIDVVSSNRAGEKWRVLILEDTGELLSATAKREYGQGLSRLLNVVDGMVGQGLRVLAIVTTNDELGDLHPAVTRPGRCASQVVFAALSASEATEWLGREVDREMTLAELYELEGQPVETPHLAPDAREVAEEAALAEVVALARRPLRS